MLRGLTFTTDGRGLITVSGDGYDWPGELILWDVGSRRQRFSTVPHSTPIAALALTRDGKRLATAGRNDGLVRLWDVVEGKLVSRGSLQMPAVLMSSGARKPEVSALAFSPDGRTLALAGQFSDVYLWQPELGTAVGSVGLPAVACALAFRPDNQELAAGTFGGGLHLLAAPRNVTARAPADSNPDSDLREEVDQLQVGMLFNLVSFLGREGQDADSDRALARAEALLGRLQARTPHSRALLARQVELLQYRTSRKGQDERAREKDLLRLAEVAGRMLDSEPGLPGFLGARGSALAQVAALRLRARRFDEALGLAETAVALLEQAVVQRPVFAQAHTSLGLALYHLGQARAARKQNDLALACFRSAAVEFEESARYSSFDAHQRHNIVAGLDACCTQALAGRSGASQGEAVEEARRLAEVVGQSLVQAPSDVAVLREGARAYWLCSRLLGGIAPREEMADCYRRRAACLTELLRRQPARQDRLSLCGCLNGWRDALDAADPQRRTLCARLVEQHRILCAEAPKDYQCRVWLLEARRIQSEVASEQQQHAEAARVVREAAAEVRSGLAALTAKEAAALRVRCGTLLTALPLVEAAQGNHAAVLPALQERLLWPVGGGPAWLRLGEVLAQCQGLARRDSRLPLPVREKFADQQAGQVVELLRRAIASDPSLRERIAAQKDGRFRELRGREDFEELLRK
jgi:hypothetical protein